MLASNFTLNLSPDSGGFGSAFLFVSSTPEEHVNKILLKFIVNVKLLIMKHMVLVFDGSSKEIRYFLLILF